LPVVHHRRGQGAEQGDSPDLRPPHPDPALPSDKARNILERLPKRLHASVRKVLRQAWELDDADKAERMIRNLARRLEQQSPGVAASILEGLDEILTVTRLGLPAELRRSQACTNIIENMMGTIRRVCRNVKRWRDASMALRWTSPAMLEATSSEQSDYWNGARPKCLIS
jgi:transposase-like protein